MNKNMVITELWKSFNEVIDNLKWYWVNLTENDYSTLIDIISWKKKEHHLHLDGSIPFKTLKSLWFKGKKENITAPRWKWLEEYLKPFLTVWEYLQTKDNLSIVWKDFITEIFNENIFEVEFRFDPHLHTFWRLSIDDVILSVIQWVNNGINEFNNKTNNKYSKFINVKCILWINRWLSSEEGLKITKEMVKSVNDNYKNHWFVKISWFDLNCSEDNNSPEKHKESIMYWRKNVKVWFDIKIHSGETISSNENDKSLYMIQSFNLWCLQYWHWILWVNNQNLLDNIKLNLQEIECCPSSNMQTGVVWIEEVHPLVKYIDLWIKVSINTDNRSIWNMTLSEEIFLCHKKYNIPLNKLKEITIIWD